MTLSEACVRCARHSCRLLIECWIDGSFATFDYFYTQYLFAAATVLAISSLIDGKESRSDKEQFESAAQFLAQLKENGNFAAEEFCRHIDAMKVCMATRQGQFAPDAVMQQFEGIDVGGFSNPTAGMALSEPSLQELLSQPVLDLQFIDASMYHDGAQGLYWPDISPESWTTNGWTPGG
jgi:proline utilization trans-activator